MYLGRIVEEGPTEQIFERPRHPYTKALLDSAPSIERLMQLPEPPAGEIPDPRTHFVGCRYEGRCTHRQPICKAEDPPVTVEGARRFFCHFPAGEVLGGSATNRNA
jgi:oligopeptide/dipeptide ABC transporter ATP-binding protein